MLHPAWGLPTWTDGNYSAARPVSLPEFEAPIPGVATEYVFTQRWQQFRNNADTNTPGTTTPSSPTNQAALSTPHFAYPDFVLVEEGPRRDLSGGVVESLRKYAKVPATHYEWESYSYPFIGLTTSFGGSPPTYVTRSRKAWKVTSRVQYDYFLVGANSTDPITGKTYTLLSGPGAIDEILDMQYVFQNTVNGALFGGTQMATDGLNVAGSALPTWPTSQQYAGMMSDALQNGWAGATMAKAVLYPTDTLAGSPPSSGHMAGTINVSASTPGSGVSVAGGIIVAEPSTLTRWLGNIYVRTTRTVLAQ